MGVTHAPTPVLIRRFVGPRLRLFRLDIHSHRFKHACVRFDHAAVLAVRTIEKLQEGLLGLVRHIHRVKEANVVQADAEFLQLLEFPMFGLTHSI